MLKKEILETSRVRLETLRGEPVAFRQQAVLGENGVTVIWTGADLDYFEELCQLEKRLAQEAEVSLVSESALVR